MNEETSQSKEVKVRSNSLSSEEAEEFMQQWLISFLERSIERDRERAEEYASLNWLQKLWYSRPEIDGYVAGIAIMVAGGYLILWGLLRLLDVFVFRT